jgi:hypothetical protein
MDFAALPRFFSFVKPARKNPSLSRRAARDGIVEGPATAALQSWQITVFDVNQSNAVPA